MGAYRDGAEWAELALEHADERERPALLALRAQLLHGAGEARAPAAYAEAIAAAPPERVPGLRSQQARACLAAGDIPGAKAALEGVQAERHEDLVRADRAARDGGLAHGRLGGRAPAGCRGRATRSPTRASWPTLKGMVAHLDGGWEQHSRRQLTQVWDSPELAGRVFDAHLCVTEYVLTAGDPYDRVAGFAKRLRAQAHQAGARRGEAFAATVLGETELFTDDLEAARAHLVDAARLSREVGAVGGESLARMRLGEALLHLGDRAGARAQLEEALELAHISPLAQHLLFLVLRRAAAGARGGRRGAGADRACRGAVRPALGLPVLPDGLPRGCGDGMRARRPARARPRVPGARRARRGGRRGGPWPAAVAEARAELLLVEGDQRAAAEALRRAAEGYAAAGQLLNERRAREALERLGRAEIST